MSELPEIKKDDWIVIDDGRWGHDYRACRVIKVSPAKVIAADKGRSEARHFYRENVLLIGTETAAKTLVERLTSSAALMREEQKKSHQRHLDRVARLTGKVQS